MQKNKAIIIMPLLLLLGAGCVKPESQTQQTINVPVSNPTVTVGNPQSGTIPMATTCPMPQQPTTVTYPPQTYPQPVQVQPVFVEPEYIPQRTPYLQGAYARNYKLKQFITNMAQKHNFDPHELNAIFSTVNRDTIALDKYNVYKTAKPSQAKTSSVGSWDKYRGNFLTSSRIQKGLPFGKRMNNI